MFKSKSSRNKVYADYLLQQSNINWDWVVIIYFYSALHLVKGFLIRKYNKTFADIENHKDIADYLLEATRGTLIPYQVRKSYMKLLWASKVARYHYSPYSKYCNEVYKFSDANYIQKVKKLIANDFSLIQNTLSPIV